LDLLNPLKFLPSIETAGILKDSKDPNSGTKKNFIIIPAIINDKT